MSRSKSRMRLFLSYSRNDQPFVKRLAKSLDRHGFLPDWDQSDTDPNNIATGISAEDEWWSRLQEMIGAADAMIFVVSPDSAASSVCDEEIAYARALEKRIIPILCRSIDYRKAPPRLAAINVKISFVEDGTDPYDKALSQLVKALEQDAGWLREAARLTQAANEWDKSGREIDRLLQGTEIIEAERWAANRPAISPRISKVILEYIEKSRDAEEERRIISDVERARFQEIDRVTRELLEEELIVRESKPKPSHGGVADEMESHKELIRSLLGLQINWHPQSAQHIASTGARDGYAEVYEFPCCGIKVKDYLSTSNDDAPSRFRADGCREIPKSIRYESLNPKNPFRSSLVQEYRRLATKKKQE